MRLIDADQMALDESEAYMSAQTKIRDIVALQVNYVVHNKIQMLLADTPTVDAVPVVRCRDCKYSYDCPGGLTCSHGVCVDCIVPPDFYCSYGERKEESQ